MKIGHFSDLHYCQENLLEAERTFGFAVSEAIRRNIDAAVISGDSTDHRLDAHSPALFALAKQIRRLAEHCPVLMLQGTFSHEPPGTLQMLGMIGARYPIYIADKVGMVALSGGQWDEYDPAFNYPTKIDLVVSTLPTVNKADLLSLVEAENVGEEMGNHVSDILISLADTNKDFRTKGIPTVLVSHGTVSGSRNEVGIPMDGLDHEFTTGSLFAAGADAVMLGHIHLCQTWEKISSDGNQIIAYPGSIGKFHYGEIGEKCFLVWDVIPGHASIEKVVTPSKRMIDIAFTGTPDLDELRKLALECHDAYVRVRFEIDEEHMKQVDRKEIKEIFQLATELKIEGTVLTIQRQRAPGISKLGSIETGFMQWCELTSTPKSGLSERLTMLQNDDPKDLARSIISGIVA